MKEHHCDKSDIIRYLSNKMTRQEEAKLQKHLLTCDSCREEVRKLRVLVQAMKKDGRAIPSWVITTAIACTLVGGIYIVQYRDYRRGERHQIEYNLPPANSYRIDSVPIDSIRYDSVRIEDTTEEAVNK